jgi:hypothetical protein
MRIIIINSNTKKLFLLAGIIGLVTLLVGAGVQSLTSSIPYHNGTTAARTTLASTQSLAFPSINANKNIFAPLTQEMTMATQPQQTSPLLWGTNLSLQDANDQVLTSATTRSLLQQMHMRIVRIPTRDKMADTIIQQAAQIVKNIGATPLVILQGDQSSSSALNNDLRIIKMMNNLFGKNIVYYEYGNEEDFFLKLSADKYTASWNRMVPQLKKAASNGHFIGPVNYQYNGDYLQYFLQHAQPLPDEVSWHEYTCGSNWDNEICLSHIDNWTVHITKARSIMQAAMGKTLPIMITEWNYTANPTPNDGKSNDESFMTTWTTKALQTFAANHIFAAMQYSCTNYAIPLVDSHKNMTTQGEVFRDQYHNIVGN